MRLIFGIMDHSTLAFFMFCQVSESWNVESFWSYYWVKIRLNWHSSQFLQNHFIITLLITMIISSTRIFYCFFFFFLVSSSRWFLVMSKQAICTKQQLSCPKAFWERIPLHFFHFINRKTSQKLCLCTYA